MVLDANDKKYSGVTLLENASALGSAVASIGGFIGSRWGTKTALAGTALGVIVGVGLAHCELSRV